MYHSGRLTVRPGSRSSDSAPESRKPAEYCLLVNGFLDTMDTWVLTHPLQLGVHPAFHLLLGHEYVLDGVVVGKIVHAGGFGRW